MANYRKLYEKAKKFYYSLGSIPCPALNGEEIIFDWRGFRHFMRKGRHKRPVADQIRRFKLLFGIKRTISDAKIISRKDGEKENNLQPMLYKDGNTEIRVIILKGKSGKKYFISIMDQS
jgi:hypothetical protein